MDVSVSDAAAYLGVTPRRVRAMIAEGRLAARQIAGRHIIDTRDLAQPRACSRPMSQRIAWAAILGPDNTGWLSPPEKSRLKRRLAELASQPDAAQILASWLASRAVATRYECPEPSTLNEDSRLVASGVSDPRSQIVGGGWEFYTQPGQAPGVIHDHLLVPDPHGPVVLREAPIQVPDPPPVLLVAVDLYDSGEPRSMDRAAQLIQEAAL